jgi:hypothetical protein
VFGQAHAKTFRISNGPVGTELALARAQAPAVNIRLLANDPVVIGASASSARRCGPTTESSVMPTQRP